MAYRLRARESVGKGLKRIVAKELRSAIDRLSRARAPESSIHEARKSIKKIRAVLQLLEETLEAGGAQRQLRSAGHLLSPLRDAEAVIESAHTLCAHGRRTLSARSCAALDAMLKRNKQRLEGRAQRGHVREQARQALRRVRRSADRWAWDEVKFAILAAAIRRGYRRARRAMREARGSQRADAFHTWRRRVKTLWYGLRLVKRRAAVGRELRDLEHLETWLGDDHNLVVLGMQVSSNGPGARTIPADRVKRLAGQRQRELRRKALAAGSRVFRRRPKAFEKHLRELWNRRRKRSGGHRSRGGGRGAT